MEKTISAHSVEHNEGLARHDTRDEKSNSNVMLGRSGSWEATLDEAQAANAHEHALTVRQTLKSYPEYQDATKTYQIPARWQSAMGSGPQAGAIIGAILNGFII
ncbi:putative alpha-glucoside transport [Fusarium globosum]|uniref:Putative alpha-glucoside transport n=1 Tax=Fusarium globosum TaxID=78864 RepID=A0A8H6D5X3_9HYPO|nr:putative alpha-glucoside transport [Fusarium globosum]